MGTPHAEDAPLSPTTHTLTHLLLSQRPRRQQRLEKGRGQAAHQLLDALHNRRRQRRRGGRGGIQVQQAGNRLQRRRQLGAQGVLHPFGTRFCACHRRGSIHIHLHAVCSVARARGLDRRRRQRRRLQRPCQHLQRLQAAAGAAGGGGSVWVQDVRQAGQAGIQAALASGALGVGGEPQGDDGRLHMYNAAQAGQV